MAQTLHAASLGQGLDAVRLNLHRCASKSAIVLESVCTTIVEISSEKKGGEKQKATLHILLVSTTQATCNDAHTISKYFVKRAAYLGLGHVWLTSHRPLFSLFGCCSIYPSFSSFSLVGAVMSAGLSELVDGFNGDPHTMRPMYKSDLEQLPCPLPKPFRQVHKEKTKEWIDKNVLRFTADLDVSRRSDVKFLARVRWFKATMMVQTDATLDMLERDILALKVESEKMENDENDLQRRRRLAKEKAKARAARERNRAKEAKDELDRQALAMKDKKMGEVERTAKKHEEAERVRKERKEAKLAALEKRKAEKLAKTQKWMDQQKSAKEKAEAAAIAAAAANKREVEEMEARKAANGRQGFDRDDHEARKAREKQFRQKSSRGNRGDSADSTLAGDGDAVEEPTKLPRRKVRKSVLELNRVAGLEMQGKYGFDDPLDAAFGDDEPGDGIKLLGQKGSGSKTSAKIKGGGGDGDEPDQFVLTAKQMKAAEIKAAMSGKPNMETYADLFTWLDDKDGAAEYMTLHDDYYSEEDDEMFDEEEVQFTLQALKKMPKLRKVPKVIPGQESPWGKKGNRKTNTWDAGGKASFNKDSTRTMEYLLSNCTISDGKLRRYRVVFNKCSVLKPGIYLTNEELVMALRRVNNKLIGASEIKYIFYILDLLNPDAGEFHDFKSFSAIAALSERVAPMERFIKGFVDQADFGSLRQKLEGAHHMFLNLFRGEDNIGAAGQLMAIPVDDLEYVFLAGGIADVPGILQALRDANMDPLTYLDYLAYIPMFIDIHASVVSNPFKKDALAELTAMDQAGTAENEKAIEEGRRIRVPKANDPSAPRVSILGATKTRTSGAGGYGGEVGGIKTSLHSRVSMSKGNSLNRRSGPRKSPNALSEVAE